MKWEITNTSSWEEAEEAAAEGWEFVSVVYEPAVTHRAARTCYYFKRLI